MQVITERPDPVGSAEQMNGVVTQQIRAHHLNERLPRTVLSWNWRCQQRRQALIPSGCGRTEAEGVCRQERWVGGEFARDSMRVHRCVLGKQSRPDAFPGDGRIGRTPVADRGTVATSSLSAAFAGSGWSAGLTGSASTRTGRCPSHGASAESLHRRSSRPSRGLAELG